jgi:excinuclease UvrABC nuclease subunit
MEEYRGEAARVEQFLRTDGESLIGVTEVARDRASSEMQFEEAERLHQRLTRIREVQTSGGELARSIDELNGVAVTGSAAAEVVELWFLIGGAWQEPQRLSVSEAAAAVSMDRRLREIAATVTPNSAPNLEHLSILMRWHSSSWCDGEWIGFESLEKIPYRKLVNAIGRVHKR